MAAGDDEDAVRLVLVCKSTCRPDGALRAASRRDVRSDHLLCLRITLISD